MSDSAIPFLSQVSLPKTAAARSGLTYRLDAFFRRGLDMLVAALGLILLSPLFLWIALRLRHDSPGPVFYRGRRVGKGGKEFGILKFRTMWEKPDSYNGALVTAHDDPRITPYGKWLRDTKINEMPQLWNVLMGDMSLVGPRPEDPDIVAKWPATLKQDMLSVRPGITSPATILFRDEEERLSSGSLMDDYLKTIMPSKLRLDTLYITNRNIFSDLDVIFWTAIVLLPMVRRLPIAEHQLYQGPFAIFTHHYLSWIIVDSLVAFAAVGFSGVIWRTAGPFDVGIGPSILLAVCFALLCSAFNTVFGLGGVQWSRAPASDSISLAFSTTAATGLVILVQLQRVFTHPFPVPMLVVAGVVSLAGFVSVRFRERLLTGFATRWLNVRNGMQAVGERVLLVGAGHNCQMATWFLNQGKFSRAFTIVGIVDDDPRKHGLKYDGHRVLGATQDIPTLAAKYDIGIIFFTISNINRQDRERILEVCQQTQTIVVILPDMMETMRDHFRIANTAFFEDGAIKRSAGKQEDYIAELDDLARQGDWEGLRTRLSELRNSEQESTLKEL